MLKKLISSFFPLLLFFIFVFNAFALDIYCPKCKRLLYRYDGVINTLWDFDFDKLKPVKGKPFHKGDYLLCPYDKAPINGWEYWFYARDREEPRMAYPSLTFYTKKDGRFIFYPHDVETILREDR